MNISLFKRLILYLLISKKLIFYASQKFGEEYGLNPGMISRWKREFAIKSGDFSKKKLVSLETQELKALRKELRNVTIERDILKKAVSIFSKNDL